MKESSGTPKYDMKSLKKIKVAIRRLNIPDNATSTPLFRDIEDPFDLVIHRQGEGRNGIFERDDVVVNLINVSEERIVVNSPIPETSTSASLSRNKETQATDENKYDIVLGSSSYYSKVYKSSNRGKSRSCSPKHKADYRKEEYKEKSPKAYHERRSGSPRRSRSRDYSGREKSPQKEYHKQPAGRGSVKEYKRRSVSPKDRSYYRKKDHETEHRVEERLRIEKQHERERRRSPHSSYSRRSRSPKPSTSGYKRQTSRSPNQSDKYKHRSYSPHERNVSKSETSRFSEGYKGKHSKSPHPGGYKSSTHRSPSPYHRGRRSRSPDEYKRLKYLKEHRSRSRSREKYRKLHERRSQSPRSKKRPRSTEQGQDMISSQDIGYVGPILPDLAFYGSEAYWIPETGPRFRPPIPLAGGIFRHPQPFAFMPRPIYPPQRFNIRQRLPIYNNRSIRILPANTETASTSTSSVSACIADVPPTSNIDDAPGENKAEETQGTPNSENDQ